MEVVGTVVRLQVQRSRLKPAGEYDPSPLLEVSSLEVGPRGATGDGHLDVHHADHPDTRNVKLLNGVSVMTTSRYAALRERYGQHLADGVAGESLLVRTDAIEDLSGDLVLETEDGPLQVTSIPAPPCVEFSRFVLGRGSGDTGAEVRAALDDLGGGARGFYLQTAGYSRITAGCRLLRA